MKILLTGAAGFIGSHTTEALVARGHHVVGVDAFDSYLYPAEVKRQNAATLVANVPSSQFGLHEADICDGAAMHRLLDGVDVVCHLAALAGVRPSLADPVRYIRTNLQGTTTLLEAMRSQGVLRMAFASSSSVYGKKNSTVLTEVAAFREDDPCLTPASPYAATKRAGELLASTYRDLYGMGISCLRFFTVYGPRQRPDMAIAKFFRGIRAGTPIAFFGDGETRRDYTFIDDIVAGVVAACERVAPNTLGIYNLGGTSTVSLAELVQQIERLVQKPALLDRQPMQPGDVPITFADITNAARDLGYAPKTDLASGLTRYWAWLQSCPS